MKRFLSFLIFTVLFGGYAMAYHFSAVCESGQTLYYNITSNTEPYTVEVTYQTGQIVDNNWIGYSTYPTGNLTIPTSVTYNNKTYSVTSIGDDAFSGCSELTSVTIPNSIISIDIKAFYGCSGITSLTIPNSVTNIGGLAFSNCSGLTSVYYTGTIAEWCGILFDSQPLTYAHNLYINNQLVTDLVIPETITEIKSYAFSGASCLTSVTIPNSVTSIGYNAFAKCYGLPMVTIPSSVTSIGDEAFLDCIRLKTVNFNATNCASMYLVWDGCTAFMTLNIGNNVTNIPDFAFESCYELTAVAIPNSVNVIGECAFANCSGMTSLTIGNSVTSIGREAFLGCWRLTSLAIPNSVSNIGSSAFWNCSGLTSVSISNSVNTIDSGVFYGCSNLTSITIPNSVTNIGEMAFYNCSNITAIYSLAVNPPMIESNSFESSICGIPVFVPCGRVSVYNDAENWNAFTNIHENPDCAGVDENEFAIIDLYPNPVINSLYINAEETICEIEIVNSMGRVVKIMEVNAENAVCDVEKLPDGVYMANVRFKNGYDNVYRKTFVKK